MSVIYRSLKNVFRNKARTVAVIVIIALSIGVFLSMSIINGNIANNTSTISTEWDTTITIAPAGSASSGFTFMGTSTEIMNESVLAIINQVPHIESVQKLITKTIMEGGGTPGQGREMQFRNITIVEGLDPSEDIILYSTGGFSSTGGELTIINGTTLNSTDQSATVALIGAEYANRTGKAVGDTIALNGTNISVVGEFTSANRMGNSTVIIPYETAKDVYNLTGMNTIYVTVDQIGNMNSTITTLQNALGTNYSVQAYSSTNQRFSQDIQSRIDSISSTSSLGLLISLMTAVAVMIFVMILVTRERIREIGIMKAIGFKNSKIMAQFLVESIALASIGFLFGLIIAIGAGPFIASSLMGISSTGGIGGPGFGGFGAQSLTAGILNFSLSLDLIAYTLVLSIVLGIIGSIYPIVRALRLKPAEALRYAE